jgi:hypothetical protein
MSGSGNRVPIGLKLKYAKNLNQTDFDKLAESVGLGIESCTCLSCINDNPGNCYTKSGAPLWCTIDVIQRCSEQLTREHFKINMVLYLGIIGEKQYMVIVRELTSEMVVLEFVSIISLKDGYLIFEPFNGNPRKGTTINYFFGTDDYQIFPIPAFLIKR